MSDQLNGESSPTVSSLDADITAKPKLRWDNILMCSFLHLGCIAAPFYFTWSGLAWCAGLAWVSAGLGITLGWHRLLTHSSYQTHPIIRYALTVLGCLTCQDGPIEWVGTHRWHHSHVEDHPNDPHSPRAGFIWSHMEWVCWHPHLNPYGAARDLMRDPVIRFIDRWWWMIPILAGAALFGGGYAVGGLYMALSWFVWGVFVRTVYIFHCTWFVNSAAHVWGYINFDLDDDARNNWWVALLTFGEGWHNNHHAQPRSAAHGMRWWEVDVTWWTILLMKRVGLAWRIVEPERPQVNQVESAAAGSGTC